MRPTLLTLTVLLVFIAPTWIHAGDSPSIDAYSAALEAVKKEYPFARWQRSGLEQYTPKVCAAFALIFDKLIAQLITLGPNAGEESKIARFKEAIEATNALNAKDPGLIETGEREDLCGLCNRIALAVGIDPKKYGDGEGPASEWRDW